MESLLEKEWLSYFVQLNEAEKKSVLLLLKTLLLNRHKDDAGFSLDQYNREIDDALAEVDAGDYVTQEEMEKQAGRW